MGFFKMFKITMLNLFRKPATLMYPVKKREFYGFTRGHIRIDFNRCIFCTMCQRKCPTDAIKVDKNGKAWQIDKLKCCMCSACVESCPVKCLFIEKQYSPPLTAAEKAQSVEAHKSA